MLTVEEAREQILASTVQMGPELVALTAARGRVLAEAIHSPIDHPAFDNSAMDGYAVRWSDVASSTPDAPVVMPVTMDIPAGAAPGTLDPGGIARIMTGAPMPLGADTVVMREDTDESDRARVAIQALPKAGQGAHVRRRGENIREKSQVLEAGHTVDAGTVGLLAMFGQVLVKVARKPRVAIISTGDELVDLGQTPGPGQIVNSSGPMFAAMVEAAGGVPWLLPIARDVHDHARSIFEEALAGADLVVSIGGVSVGDYDVVKDVLEELCGGLTFWRIRMKPGKPLAFGRSKARKVPLIGVPGNPVSSYVSFLQFVRPLIRNMLGATSLVLPTVTAVLAQEVRSPSKRLDLQRGRLVVSAEDGFQFVPQGEQGSGNPMSLPGVEGLARIPIGVDALAKGAVVTVEVVGLH